MMTLSTTFPYNGGHPLGETEKYAPVTARLQISTVDHYRQELPFTSYEVTTKPKWLDRQQILQVILPTKNPRSERVVVSHAVQVSNAVERRGPDNFGGERRPPRPNPHSSQGHNLNHGTRPGIGEIDRRIDVQIDNCDEMAASNSHRRSPSQDSDSQAQHIASPSISAPNPCREMPKPSLNISANAPLPVNRTPSTLLRPPTVTSTIPPPRPSFTVKALGNIVFPGVYPTFVPRVTRCSGITFCEEMVGDYPKEHIEKILKKDADLFKGLFGEDVVPEVNITQRIDISDENPLCHSREQVVYPKTAQNKEEKWLFVLNQEPYLQGVRVETCSKEGPCMLSEGFPLGYKTSCKQKYIYRKMLALNEEGEPSSDSFKLPSCCSCYVKMDPVARMGALSPLPKNMSPAKANLNRNH